MNKTEAVSGGSHAEVENVNRRMFLYRHVSWQHDAYIIRVHPEQSRRRRRMDLNEEAGKENESHQRYSDLLSVRWFSRPSWAGRPSKRGEHTRASERDETVDEILMNGPSNPE